MFLNIMLDIQNKAKWQIILGQPSTIKTQVKYFLHLWAVAPNTISIYLTPCKSMLFQLLMIPSSRINWRRQSIGGSFGLCHKLVSFTRSVPFSLILSSTLMVYLNNNLSNLEIDTEIDIDNISGNLGHGGQQLLHLWIPLKPTTSCF